MKKHLQILALLAAFVLPLMAVAQVTVPYTQGFEGSSMPSGWSHIGNGTAAPYSSSTYAHSGSYSLKFSGATTDNVVVFPEFEAEASQLELTIWMRPESFTSSSCGQFDVGYVTSATSASSFVAMETYSYSDFSAIASRMVTFPTAPTGARIAIRHRANSTAWYWFVDDVDVHYAPTCPYITHLAASDILTTSATLTWDGNGSFSSFVLEYDSVDFTPGTGLHNYTSVYDTSYALTGLDSGVVYHAYVRADCSDGDTGLYSHLAFTTLAASPAGLPFICDFEEDGVNGWDLINGSQSNKWYVGSAVNNGGSRSLYITNDNGTSNGYNTSSTSYTYATRAIYLDAAGEYAFSYDWRNQGESSNYDYIRAFLVPADVDFTAGSTPDGSSSTSSFASWTVPSTWKDLSGRTSPYTLVQSSSWNNVSGSFTVAAPGSYKLVFAWANDGGGGSNPAGAIDNVALMALTCPQVTDVVVVPRSDEADLSWTAGGEETEWIVVCGEDMYNTTDTFYTVMNLTPNTDYMVRVYAYCGVDDTSMGASVSFRTPCVAIEADSLPYTMNFDAGTPCWQLFDINEGVVSPSIDAYIYTTSEYSYSGSSSLYIYGYDYGSTYSGYAVLPLFDADINTLELTFKLRADEWGDPGRVNVGVMSNPSDLSTFIQVASYDAPTDGSWSSFDCSFAAVPLDHPYIAIGTLPNYNDDLWSYVDDVVVNVLPDCARPATFSALSIARADSVVLGWFGNGEASTWELAVGQPGFNPDTLTTTITGLYDSVYTFTDLVSGQAYAAYVRTDCGGEYSDWRGPLNFTPGLYLMHTTGSDTLRGCGYTIADNGGLNGAYASNCSSTLVVYPNGEDSTIRVWGTSYTESSYDYIRIYDGVGTSGTELWSDYGVSNQQSFGPFISTSGPITITFTSDGSVTYDGFEIHTACAYLSSCAAPSSFTADSVLGDTVWVSWTDTANSPAFDLVFGPVGMNPDTVVTNIVSGLSTTDYMFTGLSLGMPYDFYVRADCGDEPSMWIGPVQATPGYFYQMGISGSDTIVGCGWTITDDGGATGTYSGNCDYTVVVRPSDPTMTFMISGSSYTEGTYDYIRIYDGVGTGGTQLWNDYGVSAHQTFSSILSEEGAVTITFHSDGSVFYDGFEISLQCVPLSDCARPANFTMTDITDVDASFSWDERGTSTSWQLEYGPAGFTPGGDDATIVTATATDWTITGLTPSTQYDIYVYADCDGELSNYRMLTFNTACARIDSLPYFYGFEGTSTGSSATIDACWRKGSNSGTEYPYPQSTAYSGSRSLYFYGYYSSNYYSYAALPLFDDDLDQLQLKFKMRASQSYSYYAANITVGVMTNPNDISTFDPIQTYSATSTSTWDSFTCYLSAYAGDGRYIAFKATAPNSTQYYDYVYIDDVVVDYAPDCGPVSDLTVQPGSTTALVTWSPSVVGEYSGATVEYKEATDPSWISLTTTDAHMALTNLTVNTNYQVRVTNQCTDGMGTSVETAFHTGDFGCLAPDTTMPAVDTIGNGTSTDTYLPSYSFYGNGFSQQIYLASELTGLGQITGMKLNTSGSAQTRQWTIYLAHTSENSVNSWIVPDFMTAVWSGSVNYVSGGWTEFNFTTPFSYNGSDNLLLIIDDHTGSYVSGNSAYVHSLPSGRVSRYMYRDGSAYNPNNPSIDGTGTAISSRVNAIFSGYGCAAQSTCGTPLVNVENVESTTADIIWAPGDNETSWILEYKAASDNNWTSLGTVTTTTYHLTGLNPGSNYAARVINTDCIDSLTGNVNFTTECAQITTLPFFEDFNSWGTGTDMMPNCWSRTDSYSSYPYISSSYNHNATTGGAMYMYLSNSGSNHTHFTLPAIDTTQFHANQLQVIINGLNSYTGYVEGFTVGVMSNPNNWNTYVPVDTIILPSTTGVWTEYEIPLDSYNGNGAYITVAAWTTSSYCYPYLDDITVEMIPSCPRPDMLQATNATTSSVDLSWHERGGATDWIIEYGPVGFTLGTGIIVNATSNPFTLTGLPSSFDGEYYVRSVCSSTDSGDYSRYSCRFSTTQVAATLPYTCDFEGTEANAWQVNSNSNINWFVGTADAASPTHSMYVSADNGLTVGNENFSSLVNATAFRDVDFGTVDSSFTFTFKAKAGGSTDAAYDALMVFLVDPTAPVVAPTTAITSPWGSVNDLYRIATVRLDTTWREYSASFDTIHGIQRVAFFWFNQNTASSHPYIGGPAAVDDITIDYSPCPRPLNMDVIPASITSTSATLTWDGPTTAQYRVAYRVAGASASTNRYAAVSTNTFTLTGLNPMTTYYAWVQKICGSDSSLFSDGVEFTTEMCDSPVIITNDSVCTQSTSYFPGYATYNYSYSEVIIDSADLAGIGDITALSYKPQSANAGTYFNNCTIYMANTTQSDLSSGFIQDLSTFQVVYTGDLNYDNTNWQIVGFDTTFTWDGHSNIVIAVNRQNGSWTSSDYFDAFTASSDKARYIYQDSGPYTVGSISGGYSTSITPIYRLISCGTTSTCAAPIITGHTGNYEMATITWSGNGANYEVNIKEAAAVDYAGADIPVLGNSHTFTGLQPATNYTVRVRQDCSADSLGYSAYATYTFMTDSLPCLAPQSLTVTDVTNATATFAWTARGYETAWDIHVWFAGGLDTTYTVTTNPATVSGFTAGVTYNAAIRALCGTAHNIEGEYGDTITFTTQVCPNVTGLSFSNVTPNSVTLSWTADPMAESWVIEYGYSGFSQGRGTTATSANSSYVINGLEEDTPYDFYVRAVCGTDWTSEGWASTSATTAEGGVTCDAPTNVTAVVAGNAATINWNAGEGNISFEIEYGVHGFSHGAGTTTTATTAPATIANLAYETNYDVYVRAVCAQNTYSAWSSLATFTTEAEPSTDCDPVQNLAATQITDNSVIVTWTPGEHGSIWEVVLTDAAGNTLDQATTEETSHQFSNLTESTDYIVKVRTKCDDDQYSSYVSVSFRTTGEEGIDDILNASCTIYPNPTSSATTISVSGVNGQVRISVVDMNGRVVTSETMECATDCAKTMDVDALAQGAYFVRITGENINMVKKLIVR
ncbi:MAG: fibronectin type III domain-containing protein [Bacteroidales bacterium]|nr:fibronectin type III domain-containing protein [Bacteroidales bacterium]